MNRGRMAIIINSALISDFPSHLLKIVIRTLLMLNVKRRPDKTASHGEGEWNKS